MNPSITLHPMLLKLLALAALLLVGDSLLAAASQSSARKDNQFGNVRARFVLGNHSIRKRDSLTVRVTLTNTSTHPVTFSYIADFILHVRAYDQMRREVPFRTDAPILEPIRRDVVLQPGKSVTIEPKLDVMLYYDLAPGRYYLRFFYDLRLIEDHALFEQYRTLYHSSDYVLWNSKYYPFRVVK